MKKEYPVLAIIFLLTFAGRLYFAFSNDYFEYDAYFNLRQSEHIMDTGYPAYNDPYSYEGRFYTFLPIFHYLLAGFGIPFNLELMAKVLPNLIASLLGVVVYFIVKDITKNQQASLFGAFIAGFIPIFFVETFNSISTLAATIPVTFFLCYCFMNIKTNQKFVVLYVVFFIALTLLHPSSLVFVFSLFFYLMLCKIEKIPISNGEIELAIFSIFFWIWANLMIYKKALLQHGISIIWQNLPPMLYQQSFVGLNIIDAILKIGLLPFIFGLVVVYKGFFSDKNKHIYLYVAFAFSAALMLWLKIISLILGFIFLGVVLTILFGQFYAWFFEYIEKTKISHYKLFFLIGIITVFTLTSVFTSLSQAESSENTQSKSEADAMLWIKNNTPKESIILTSPEEGHFLTYLAERKNVADTNFLLVSNIDQKLADIKTIYSTKFKTQAISLLNKNDISYIYVSNTTKSNENINSIIYEDGNCIQEVYSKMDVKIYQSGCVLSR